MCERCALLVRTAMNYQQLDRFIALWHILTKNIYTCRRGYGRFIFIHQAAARYRFFQCAAPHYRNVERGLPRASSNISGLPWGWHFNSHTHPIPTGISIGIPMGIPIPTEPEVSTLLRVGLPSPIGRFYGVGRAVAVHLETASDRQKNLGVSCRNVWNFAQGLKFMADFRSKMSVCRHELGVQPPPPPPQYHPPPPN